MLPRNWQHSLKRSPLSPLSILWPSLNLPVVPLLPFLSSYYKNRPSATQSLTSLLFSESRKFLDNILGKTPDGHLYPPFGIHLNANSIRKCYKLCYIFTDGLFPDHCHSVAIHWILATRCIIYTICPSGLTNTHDRNSQSAHFQQ